MSNPSVRAAVSTSDVEVDADAVAIGSRVTFRDAFVVSGLLDLRDSVFRAVVEDTPTFAWLLETSCCPIARTGANGLDATTTLATPKAAAARRTRFHPPNICTRDRSVGAVFDGRAICGVPHLLEEHANRDDREDIATVSYRRPVTVNGPAYAVARDLLARAQAD